MALRKLFPPVLKSNPTTQTYQSAYNSLHLKIQGGSGGDGFMVFRREKDQPVMGPDGGDGGNGGDVYFIGCRHTKSLDNIQQMFYKDFKYREFAHFEKLQHRKEFGNLIKGNKGEIGGTDHKKGKQGVDKFVKLPIGTLVLETQQTPSNIFFKSIITKHNQVVLAAKKGFGGLGNHHFTTAISTTPELAVPASEMRPPDDKNYFLTMLQISHINVLGFKGAGKSSFVQFFSDLKSQRVVEEDHLEPELTAKFSNFNARNSVNPRLNIGQFKSEKLVENEQAFGHEIDNFDNSYLPILGTHKSLNKTYGLNVSIADFPDFKSESKTIQNIYKKFSIFSYINYIIIDVSEKDCAEKCSEIFKNLPEFAVRLPQGHAQKTKTKPEEFKIRTKIIMNKEPKFAEEILNFRNLNFPDVEVYLLPYDLDRIEKEIEDTFLEKSQVNSRRREKVRKFDRGRFSLR